MPKLTKLEKEIQKHRKFYYQDRNPQISDAEFDELVEKLKNQKPDSPVLQQVGYIPKRHKIALPFILGSLENINVANVLTWMRRQKDFIFVSYKLDGVSVFAEWKNGKLETLSTRGNGKIGEDLYEKACFFKDLPLKIPIKERVCARGEAIVIGKVPKGYKTRRSAAIGILGRDDYKLADNISIRFYTLLDYPKLPEKVSSRFKKMSLLGLKCVKSFVISQKYLKSPIKSKKLLNRMIEIIQNRNKLDYDIDGLVISNNTGYNENVAIPKNSVSFKIDRMPVETTVTEIEWSVSRTGRVVPVVHIDQIEIDGVAIEHPTGHNYDWLRKQCIGKGAIITVIRSGDTIPKITSVISPAKIPARPKRCQSCNSILKLDGVDLVCTSKNCRQKQLLQVEYFIKTLGAENVALPTLDSLNITTLQKFYEITKDEILKAEGFQEAKANIFVEEREKTLTTTEDSLLAAFGIPLIGPKTAKKIVDELFVGKFHVMFRTSESRLYEDVVEISGIGDVTAETFADNIKQYKDIYKFLKSKGLKFKQQKRSNKLEGKTFLITGTLSESREKMELLIINNGGRLTRAFNSLDYLVCNDKNSTSTKAKKAREKGIKFITEVQLRNML